MIVAGGKYACETCIKGHRSSNCRHTDRPLFEIKKKGRPVTQCEHCRELRKTKQVHVKCICESRTEPSSSSSKQVPKPGFESAAFPNGLPEALEASVAFQSLAEGTSSDSDHGGAHTCKSGDPCTCVMPRRNNNKKKGVPTAEYEQPSSHLPHDHHSRTSSQILARMAELRPVLPRPSQDGFNHGGPVHLPSTGISHAHPSRHPEHVFNPYERAYGMTHQHPGDFQSYLVPGPSNPTFGFNDQGFNSQMMGVPNTAWSTTQDDVGLSSSNNFSSIPPSALPPPDTALSIYDSQPDANIDDWLSQMLSSTTSSEPFQNFPPPPNGQQYQQPPPPQSWGGGGSTTSGRSFSYSDQQQSNLDRNPRVQSPPFTYGRSPPPPSMGYGERGSSGRPGGVIDPRLLPSSNGNMTSYFGPPRSRSPSSSSSQSSHQSSQDNNNNVVPIYRPSERVQGIFSATAGGRTSGGGGGGGAAAASPPNMRHLMNSRGPTTSSGGGSGGSRRPSNRGDDSGNPPLAGLHIY